jgi:glycosyltransferase involved in cell wall biosynthesis
MSYGWFNDRFIHPVHDGILVHENVKDIDLRKEFELPKDSFVCVGAGRLVYQKGYDYLIEVAKMAKDQNLNWRFVILGIGRLENQLKKMVSDLQVENYIKFIGFRKDVLPFMKAADLFVLSSRSESMTNVLREAMSVRTACVATDVYGISELIENMKSGIIVEPGSPSAIYNGIKLLANDPKLKSEIEENSYQRILEGFTMQKMIDETEELFTKLLKEQN